MKIQKQFQQIFLLTFILFGYVNCSLQSSLKFPFQTAMKSSGNGGGYEGKPDGAYYHFIPNYTCSGHSSPEGITEIKDGQAYLYDNKGNQCSTSGAPIAIFDIDFSPFQNEFISVRDQLFKRYDEKPQGIPNNLAEVLCRDDFANPTFEIVTHFDRETNQTLTRIYFPDALEPDFPISRILSSQEVSYVSDRISFKVNFSKPSQPQKKYAGHIYSTTLKQIKNQNLTCVIGGSLDTSNWPLRQLTDLSTWRFNFVGLGEVIFSFQISKFVSHIYKIGFDNSIIDFTKKILGDNYSSSVQYRMTDKNIFVFQARSFSEIIDSWYVYDFRNEHVTRLTNLQSGPTIPTYLMIPPEVTENQHLIYSESIPFYPFTTVLHDLNLQTNAMNNFVDVNEGVAFITLTQSNKVIIVFQKSIQANNLQIYDIATQATGNLNVHLPEGCSLDLFLFTPVKSEQSLLTGMLCNGRIDKNLILISLKDGSIQRIAMNKYIAWSSQNKKWFMFGDYLPVIDSASGVAGWHSSTKSTLLYNMETGQSFQTPIDPNLGSSDFNRISVQGSILGPLPAANSPALINDQWLYGFEGDIQNSTLSRVDLKTGSSTKFCEATVGRKLFVSVLPNQKLYLFTYDDFLKIYRFYSIKGATDCPLINEFPSVYGSVSNLKTANIGFALTLGTLHSIDEAVFVPIDGRPPLKLSYGDHGPWQIDISPNKNRIILLGPSANEKLKLFSFDL